MKRIKDVSHMAGITKRTLQYYDDEGLLYVKRSETNERLYSKEDLMQLWKILVCKDLGMTLSQIKRVMYENEDSINEILKSHIEQMKKEKELLEKRICLAEKINKYGMPPENFTERKENPEEYMRKICLSYRE